MPNPPAPVTDQSTEPDLGGAALAKLRQGSNPFQVQVATVGTAGESLLAGVPEFAAGQFADLLDIVRSYREGSPATRVYPLLGDRGTGKTHLLYRLRKELANQTATCGDETMLVVVDRLLPGMDPIDYLLWQIVNHLLAQSGDGERMLNVIAGRVTARLLAEALRRLAPHQRLGLIPYRGIWDRLRRRLGTRSRVEKILASVEAVIQTCGRKNPSPQEIRDICQSSDLAPAVALDVIEKHLQNVESKDILGWFRKQLFAKLAKLALTGEREPFEEFHAGSYPDAPANVKDAGNLSRRLLDTWLELLKSLNIPVVVVFDQLEDYLRSADTVGERTSMRFFTGATALFINELRHVCILIFAEETFWTELMNRSEQFASERLRQPFSLPGRPAKTSITMPSQIGIDILNRLVDQRIRVSFHDLVLTGLPSGFPFTESDLASLNQEPSIRACLRRLAKRYDEIVFPIARPPVDFKQELGTIWTEHLHASEQTYGSDMNFKVAFIPEVQNALHAWLEALQKTGLTGAGPWKKLELITDPNKQPYGIMSVVRCAAVHVPGIGIAVWLGRLKAQPLDLQQRLSFFDANPCKIKTLVLLRADGEGALRGKSKEVYDEAVNTGRDLRVQKYDPKHLHALMAFLSWHQEASARLEAAIEVSPNSAGQFVEFLGELSKELLGWLDAWRKPAQALKGANS